MVQIKGIMKKEDYHSILQRHAIPSGLRIIEIILFYSKTMTQNIKHASKLCKHYLANKEQAQFLRLMNWPAQYLYGIS